MYVGNEYFFKSDTPYYDKNGRLHMKPPEWGQDIYIWWHIQKYVCKDGTINYYKYLIFSKGGQHERYRCGPGEHYPKKFIDLHGLDFALNHSFFMGNFKALARFAYKPKKEKTNRKRGRPKAFSSEVYDLLEACGFGANGSEIFIKYKKYLTKEAAAFRFSLLSDDDKVVIGDSETLLVLSRQAYSLLKSRNRRSIRTSYDSCFGDNLMQKINSVDTSSGERLHEALVAA